MPAGTQLQCRSIRRRASYTANRSLRSCYVLVHTLTRLFLPPLPFPPRTHSPSYRQPAGRLLQSVDDSIQSLDSRLTQWLDRLPSTGDRGQLSQSDYAKVTRGDLELAGGTVVAPSAHRSRAMAVADTERQKHSRGTRPSTRVSVRVKRCCCV